MNRYITFFLLLVCSVVLGQDVEAILTEKVKLLDKSYTTKELQTLAKDFETLATSAASHLTPQQVDNCPCTILVVLIKKNW